MITIGSARQLLNVLANSPSPVDMLLTDIVMPHMHGPELSGICLAQRPGLRVLYMSGYGYDSVGHDGLLHPSLSFIQKPFAGAGLLQRVRAILDTPATLVM